MKVKKHDLYTSKDGAEKTIAIASDIHLEEITNPNKTLDLLDALDREEPTAILLPGDLYNIDDTILWQNKNIASSFIESISRIAPVFYVQGNSELKSVLLPQGLYSKTKSGNFHLLCESLDYSEPVENVVHLDGMNIAGITFPKEFYYQNEAEKINTLLSKYQEYLENIARLCEDENFNILLCHDPIIISVAEQIKALSKFDLVASGHNHGGLVPTQLKPIFKLLGADLDKLFPTYCKGIVEKGNTQYLISEGVTKFHSEFGVLSKLETFHEGTIDVVRVLKKNNK